MQEITEVVFAQINLFGIEGFVAVVVLLGDMT
jgi:hypothetical protein